MTSSSEIGAVDALQQALVKAGAGIESLSAAHKQATAQLETVRQHAASDENLHAALDKLAELLATATAIIEHVEPTPVENPGDGTGNAGAGTPPSAPTSAPRPANPEAVPVFAGALRPDTRVVLVPAHVIPVRVPEGAQVVMAGSLPPNTVVTPVA